MADLEADIPQYLHQFLELFLLPRRRRFRQQDQHVDIGIGEQFAAPVTADGHQRAVAAEVMRMPGLGQRFVDVAPQLRKQAIRFAVALKGFDRRLMARF